MSQLFQTPFSRASTASQVIEGADLSGKMAIVTGAGSGIGIETARALASAGAEVTLAVRRPQAAQEVAAGIARETGNDGVFVRALDLSDQESVRAFAAAWDQPLHILVNNAGVMALPELERTAEGWEMQFARNFMGHFALTVRLHDASAAATSRTATRPSPSPAVPPPTPASPGTPSTRRTPSACGTPRSACCGFDPQTGRTPRPRYIAPMGITSRTSIEAPGMVRWGWPSRIVSISSAEPACRRE